MGHFQRAQSGLEDDCDYIGTIPLLGPDMSVPCNTGDYTAPADASESIPPLPSPSLPSHLPTPFSTPTATDSRSPVPPPPPPPPSVMAVSAESPSTSYHACLRKRISFHASVLVWRTYLNSEYDRTPIIVERLTRADVFELVRYRGELMRETKRCEKQRDDFDNGVPLVAGGPTSSMSSDNNLSKNYMVSAPLTPPTTPGRSSSMTPVTSLQIPLPSPPLGPPTSPSPFPNGRLAIPVPLRPPPALHPPPIPPARRHSFEMCTAIATV
ncbi:hypothetical protein HKX48_007824 [Thoreauomyces humboldtii]|nr:hypothetical protein HKX48_007824 [Thoreauomyces humboldtii]